VTIQFLYVAQIELDDAITWYNAQAIGLGDAFLIEAIKTFRLIEQYPDAWHRLSRNTRRCRLARFPYGIIYTSDADSELVIAVAHLHRAPQYWRDRL
jgi:hypothetical protein